MRPYPHPDEHQPFHTLLPAEQGQALELLSRIVGANGRLRVTCDTAEPIDVPASVTAAWLDVLSLMATKPRGALYAFDEDHEIGVIEASRITSISVNAIRLAIDRGDVPARREGVSGFVMVKMKDVIAYRDNPKRALYAPAGSGASAEKRGQGHRSS